MERYAPEELDWVSARIECSASKVFQQLKSRAKLDVEKRNERLTNDEKQRRVRFSFFEEPADIREQADNYFSVSRVETVRAMEKRKDVQFFQRDETTIAVTSQDQQQTFLDFVAIPTLTITGDCRLTVNDEELTQWQFLRTALEDLFFPQALKG
jgi:hypothetical protein